MNQVILMGRLTKDPEVRMTPSEKTVCTFTMAVDRPFTDKGGKREADFINCVVWGKTGEAIGNHVSKGHRLLVQGRLQNRNYQAKDGTKRYISEVIANHCEFVEKKTQAARATQENTPEAKSEAGSMESFGTTVGFDEEIPF